MTDPIETEDQMPTEANAMTDEPMAADEQPTAAAEAPETAEDAPEASAKPTESTAAAPETSAESTESTEDAPETSAEPEAPAVVEAAPEVDAPKTAAAKPARKPKADAAPEAEAEGRKAAATAEPEASAAPARSSKPVIEGPKALRIRYQTEVIPALVKQFEYANPNMVPKLEKIVVNVGLGEALSNAKAIDAAAGDLTMITGQKPIVTKARRSIAQFKIRTGNPIGLKVTLRGPRMWDFLERLLLLTLPRIRDFRGTPSRSFDGRGNYSLGMREQIAFPEIDYDKVDRLRGLEVSIVTTAKSDEESKRLLELLGMPFAS
jgi:large subunit ribosomal protein L5